MELKIQPQREEIHSLKISSKTGVQLSKIIFKTDQSTQDSRSKGSVQDRAEVRRQRRITAQDSNQKHSPVLGMDKVDLETFNLYDRNIYLLYNDTH